LVDKAQDIWRRYLRGGERERERERERNRRKKYLFKIKRETVKRSSCFSVSLDKKKKDRVDNKAQENHREDRKCKSPESKSSMAERRKEREREG
jgi:hypothetical protein